MRRITTVYIEEEYYNKVKNKNINLSDFVNNVLKDKFEVEDNSDIIEDQMLYESNKRASTEAYNTWFDQRKIEQINAEKEYLAIKAKEQEQKRAEIQKKYVELLDAGKKAEAEAFKREVLSHAKK